MKQPREIFIEEITALAEKDSRVMLIVGDVGYSFVEKFQERFPDQFLNTGVAEQNMMGVAAGLSLAGWKPYVYSMRNFIVFRPYEQVRNDIAYSKANVKLCGVTGGASYVHLGLTHNTYYEDIPMMESLPNMNVHRALTPEIFQEEAKRIGPAYFII